jgi:hypothetical protein
MDAFVNKDEFMNIPPEEEMLSAYVDGELTGPERAEVEAWLTTDAAARHLLDELRAVRDLVGALPHQHLTEDLSASVLELAERRMLSEPAPAVESTPAPFFWSGSARRFLGRRALTWAALAVGLALVIALSPRERPSPVTPTAPVDSVVKATTQEPRVVPELRPMPEGGIVSQNRQSAPPKQKPAILLVKCFVRAEADRNLFNSIMARQRIVRDDSDQLINEAVDLLGVRAKQTPPQGLVAVDDPRYVYTEANAQQIEGLLAALASRTRDFPALTVEPGPKAQKAWQTYGHGLGATPQTPAATPSTDTSETLRVLVVVQPVKPAGK